MILQTIKAKAKQVLILTGVILLALLGYYFWHKHAKKVDAAVSTTVLAHDQKEKIVVDPIKHTITVVTKKANGQDQTNVTYFPDRPTAITENNNGKLSIQDRVWGPEARPYLGFGYDSELAPRLHTGLDLLYFHKFDAGLGLGFNPTRLKDTRGNLNLSYNIYDNTSLAFSYDNHHTIGGFIKVRF